MPINLWNTSSDNVTTQTRTDWWQPSAQWAAIPGSYQGLVYQGTAVTTTPYNAQFNAGSMGGYAPFGGGGSGQQAGPGLSAGMLQGIQQQLAGQLGNPYGQLFGGLTAQQQHPYGDNLIGTFPADFNFQMQMSPFSVPLTASAPIPQEELQKIQDKQRLIERKATKLLRSKLCGRELKALERFGFFDVRCPDNPDVAYRIPESGMIVMFEKGAPVKRLCIHPADSLPRGDRLLALKLLVEAEPRELHRVANVHRIDRRDGLAIGGRIGMPPDRLERLPLMC